MFSECVGSPKKSVREGLEATQAAVQRLGYLEEDRHVLPGLRIRAAGLHKLAQLAIETFGEYILVKQLQTSAISHRNVWRVQTNKLATN